jgi:hypothetical protein
VRFLANREPMFPRPMMAVLMKGPLLMTAMRRCFAN